VVIPGQAIIRALETTPISSVPLVIKSNSHYAIKCNFFSASPSPHLFLDLLRDIKVSRNDFLAGAAVTKKHLRESSLKNLNLVKYTDALLTSRGRSRQQVMLERVRG
jgi:hypothetical protein